MSLTVVTYHYVRDVVRTRYPGFKARTIAHFEGQLDYLQKNYNLIGHEQLFAAISDPERLVSPSAVLTFDDGYIDHYTTVFPILRRRRLTGLFFPSTSSVRDRRLLDVNKVQLICAMFSDHVDLTSQIMGWIDRNKDLGLHSSRWYWEKFAKASRWDPPATGFVKRMLQRALPSAARRSLLDELFVKHVNVDEAVLADELYMTSDQLRVMIADGMYVGSHGAEHFALADTEPSRQAQELDIALGFLAEIGAPTDRWMICYPHGSYDSSLLELAAARGCILGFTTNIGVADLSRDQLLQLPRLDTNDLPITANAPLTAL